MEYEYLQSHQELLIHILGSGEIHRMDGKIIGNQLITFKQIAGFVYLLSLEKASAVNGSVVKVDSGYALFN